MFLGLKRKNKWLSIRESIKTKYQQCLLCRNARKMETIIQIEMNVESIIVKNAKHGI